MAITKVPGKNKGTIKMFTLSTCIWCKRTKQFLADLGVEYQYIDVDLLSIEEKEATMDELKRWNERCSFPTLVINEDKCIIGFREGEIKEALGI